MDSIVFLFFAAFAVVCGVNLVLQKHPISSALSLVGVMGALSALYLELGGEFIAMAQLIVYAGAIMVLFVFVIMLLNAGSEHKTQAKLWAKYFGLPLLVALVGAIVYLLRDAFSGPETVKFGSFSEGDATAIGENLFKHYLLPFEVTSVLVLIAIVGAIVLAQKEIE